MIKTGGGTLELSGVLANTFDASTRILEGTLLLNKEPGVNALINTIEVGIQQGRRPGGDPQAWRLRSDARMTAVIRVHASGLFDLNNQSDAIDQLLLVSGPTGSADVALGTGTLTIARQGAGQSRRHPSCLHWQEQRRGRRHHHRRDPRPQCLRQQRRRDRPSQPGLPGQ